MDDAASRKELDRLLAGHSTRTVRLAAQVSKAVAEAVARGEDPSQAVASGMDKVGMAKAVRDTVATAVVQSVCVGYGIWPSVSAAPPEAMGGLRKTALSGVWDESGMKLSDRLHGTDTAMRAEIAQAIKGHVDAKASAWDAQRKIYDGYGMGGAIRQVKLSELPKDLQDLADKARNVLTPEDFAQLQGDAKRLRAYADRLATAPLKAAYGQMADRLEKGLTKGLDRLVQTATEEKARYHASRILRTEAARAWGQGFHAECLENQDVVGIKWNLSTSHKIFDICDFNHQADLYGMGPGVYPKAKWPRYPAHPHCHCPQSKVFVGMVPPERDNVEAGGKAALDGMTESQRKRLLTIKGAQGFQGGSSWKGDLRNHDGAVSSGMSPGARAVVMGVKQWQPDLQLVPGVAAPVASSAAKVVQEKAVHPVRKVVEFVPAKSVKDAEQWARDNKLADQVSYKGLHVDAANGINKVLKEHLDMFPGLRSGLQFVGSSQEQVKLAKAARKAENYSEASIRKAFRGDIGKSTKAFSTDPRVKRYEGFYGISFNTEFFGTTYENTLAMNEITTGQGQWYAAGRRLGVEGTVAHELGHQIDALFGLRSDAEVATLWEKALANGAADTVSKYAASKGITEAIAEGWAEAFGSGVTREFAEGLKRRIFKLKGTP